MFSTKSAFLKNQEGGFFIYLHVQNRSGINTGKFWKVQNKIAQLAELVDALVSGTSVLLDVKVRVLYWAPGEIQIKSKALKINTLSAFLFSIGIKKAQKKSF